MKKTAMGDDAMADNNNSADRAHRGGERQHPGSVIMKSASVNGLADLSPSGRSLGTLVCFRPCSAGETLPAALVGHSSVAHDLPSSVLAGASVAASVASVRGSAASGASGALCSYFCEPAGGTVASVAAHKEGPEGPSAGDGVPGGVVLVLLVIFGVSVVVSVLMGRVLSVFESKPGGVKINTPGDECKECPILPGIGYICDHECLCKRYGHLKQGASGEWVSVLPAKQVGKVTDERVEAALPAKQAPHE